MVVHQFLMRVNDSFGNLRSQILMRKVLPDMGKIYALCKQEENQKERHPDLSQSNSFAAFASTSKTSSKSSKIDNALKHTKSGQGNFKTAKITENSGSKNFKSKGNTICSHCKGNKHTMENCFWVVGFPEGQKYHTYETQKK